jgi:hypothetical protein
VVHLTGCSGSEKSAGGAAPTPGSKRNPASVDVTFKGLCLFAVPKAGTGPADVILPKPELITGLERHYGTLRIPRWAVHKDSDAEPAVADETFVYFSLAGKRLEIIPRTTADRKDWSDSKDGPLTSGVGDVDPYAEGCGTAAEWNSVKWMIDLNSDLWPGAVLRPDWATSEALYGAVRLTHGLLESGQDDHGEAHVRYKIPGHTPTRVVKEKARYSLTAPFVQFGLGQAMCLVDTSAARFGGGDDQPVPVAIDHVPAHWITSDEMTDFRAYANLLQLSETDPMKLPLPGHRGPCPDRPEKFTGGCGCCPASRLLIG